MEKYDRPKVYIFNTIKTKSLSVVKPVWPFSDGDIIYTYVAESFILINVGHSEPGSGLWLFHHLHICNNFS